MAEKRVTWVCPGCDREYDTGEQAVMCCCDGLEVIDITDVTINVVWDTELNEFQVSSWCFTLYLEIQGHKITVRYQDSTRPKDGGFHQISHPAPPSWWDPSYELKLRQELSVRKYELIYNRVQWEDLRKDVHISKHNKRSK